jgi:hypothetical protein
MEGVWVEAASTGLDRSAVRPALPTCVVYALL